jgi:hypothetical protein
MYAPVLRLLDRAIGSLDEELASFSFVKARESAWLAAVAFANARDEQERLALRANLNDRVAVLGRLILSPTAMYPWLWGALRYLEGVVPWWSYVTLSGLQDGKRGRSKSRRRGRAGRVC